MAGPDQQSSAEASSRQYRRGALLGMTMAEAFILIAFALLLLLAAWKVQADQEISRYQKIQNLTPEDVRAVAEMHDAGRLDKAARLASNDAFEAMLELQENNADLARLNEIATDQERWRLIDEDELRRMLDGAQKLPEYIQRDLADLVEIDDPRNIVRLLEISKRIPEDSRASFEAFLDLQEKSPDLARLSEIATNEENWRKVEISTVRRIIDDLEQLPEETQKQWSDLMAAENPDEISRSLELSKQIPENQKMRKRLADIGAQLDEVRQAEAELIDDLQRTLGSIVSEVGGHIDEHGSIVLQDSILFDVGSAQITERMELFLEEMCVPWMQVMRRAEMSVSGAQIEGHASSEWRAESTVQEAYLNNLDLSQRRSAAVLRECLALVSKEGVDRQVEAWARKHLRAVGFSSAKPVVDEGGIEVADQSRRVVFSLDLDEASVIESLEGKVKNTPSSP